MMIKLVVVIVSLAAVSISNSQAPVAFGYSVGYGYASPAAPNVHIFPTLPDRTFVPHAAPNAQETGKTTPDPAITAVRTAHNTFMEKHHIKPPYHYSYGYEVYDWRTGQTTSQYESRYGDVAVGTYLSRASDGRRTIVDYTIDTPHGFYAALRKDFQGHAVNFGYGRLSGPLAYASHPAHEEYESRTTILADPAAIDNPLIKSAYSTHRLLVEYFDLVAPFNASWGYEVTDAVTGRRSQYETYHGDRAEGSYVVVELDGTKRRIDYSVTPRGFAFTSPDTLA